MAPTGGVPTWQHRRVGQQTQGAPGQTGNGTVRWPGSSARPGGGDADRDATLLCSRAAGRGGLDFPLRRLTAIRDGRSWRRDTLAGPTTTGDPISRRSVVVCAFSNPQPDGQSRPRDTVSGTSRLGRRRCGPRRWRTWSRRLPVIVSRWAKEGKLPLLKTPGGHPTLPGGRDPPAGRGVAGAADGLARYGCSPFGSASCSGTPAETQFRAGTEVSRLRSFGPCFKTSSPRRGSHTHPE